MRQYDYILKLETLKAEAPHVMMKMGLKPNKYGKSAPEFKECRSDQIRLFLPHNTIAFLPFWFEHAPRVFSLILL